MGMPKPIIQQLLKENADHACPEAPEICVRVMAIADLPDMFGQYQVVAFWNNFDKKEHAALIHGDIFEKEDVPVRLHSECLTGDTLGSLRCDCRDQLQESMRRSSLYATGGSGYWIHQQDQSLPAAGRRVRYFQGKRNPGFQA